MYGLLFIDNPIGTGFSTQGMAPDRPSLSCVEDHRSDNAHKCLARLDSYHPHCTVRPLHPSTICMYRAHHADWVMGMGTKCACLSGGGGSVLRRIFPGNCTHLYAGLDCWKEHDRPSDSSQEVMCGGAPQAKAEGSLALFKWPFRMTPLINVPLQLHVGGGPHLPLLIPLLGGQLCSCRPDVAAPL